MALTESQCELLKLLQQRDSETGVFFMYWDEVRDSNRSTQWMKDHENAPNLDWGTKRALDDLKSKGFIEHLAKRGTSEGEHYRILPAGLDALSEATDSAVRRFWRQRRKKLIGGLAALFFVWIVYLFGPELGILEFFSNSSSK